MDEPAGQPKGAFYFTVFIVVMALLGLSLIHI